MFRIITITLGILLLSGCGGPNEPVPIPEGEQTVSGILLPAEISFVRRGSHLLRQEGADLYYVESALVQLRTYEGQNVVLTGVLEYNTDPFDLPVLVVNKVEQAEEEMRTETFKSVGMSLTVPHDWRTIQNETGEGVQFLIPAWERPVLSLFEEENNDAIQGFSITVGGKRALRYVDEQSGAEKISIETSSTGSLITLLFTPGMHPQATELKADWLAVLRSISFASTQNNHTNFPPVGTGSVAGVPCGGTAGVLCPEGYYCAVTDLQENVGFCKKVN